MGSGFGRQVILQVPEIAATAFCDGFLYRAGATVVGSNHQQPIAVLGIQVFEVPGRRVCALDIIATLIYFPVHFQAQFYSGTWHQLPGANGTGPGSCTRFHFGFDHSQVFQFTRQAVLYHNAIHHIEIGKGPGFHVLQVLAVFIHIIFHKANGAGIQPGRQHRFIALGFKQAGNLCGRCILGKK